MNLLEENLKTNEQTKNSKSMLKIIIFFIILTIIIIFSILGYLMYLESSNLTVTVDGVSNETVKNMLIIEADGEIYAPVKEIASYLGSGESYNGHYEERSEAINKCYVQSENEAVNFTLWSNQIEKLDLTDQDANYEIITTELPLKSLNGILYAPQQMIEEAFNITFEYNQTTNTITIFTLEYLIQYYQTTVLDLGYSGLSEKFVNEKAILDDRLIVIKETISGESYGVVDTSGNIVIESKYQEIEYLNTTNEYLIKTNNKMGILTDRGDYVINAEYDKIDVLDAQKSLYVVAKNSKYGVVDFKGNTKIHIEYDQIGIDISRFNQPELKNKYILVDNIIPVRKEETWALFDKNGNKLTEFIYTDLGYITSNDIQGENLLIVPGYNLIVVEINEKYGLISSTGKLVMQIAADDIYMTTEDGERKYYVLVNNNNLNLIDWLDDQGVENIVENEEVSQEETEVEGQQEEEEVTNEEQEASSNTETQEPETETQQNQTIAQAEIEAFNVAYEMYSNKEISGAEAKALINNVIANNSNSNRQITITKDKIKYDNTVDATKINTSIVGVTDKYNIKIDYDSEGYVKNINII